MFSYKLYQVIRTYLLFSFAMIFFRASSVSNAIEIIKSIFTINLKAILNNLNKGAILNIIQNIGLDFYDLAILIVSLLILFIVQFLARKRDVREKLLEQNIVFKWGILYILIFFIIIFGCYGVGYDATAFIYRQF